METLRWINYIIAVLLSACYAYQIVYIAVSLWNGRKKKASAPDAPPHRFAILVSARNERGVIAQLIHSVQRQDYPEGYADVFVVADNCTDDTAQLARAAGAHVYERNNLNQVGKGYALDFLLARMAQDGMRRQYDGYLVLDADNLLDERYLSEMNKTFSQGHRIITSYRNSKNYGDNWISAGYSLWFLREARYLNDPRMALKTSCAVSGTGFLVHRDIIEREGGWKHYLLTEDIEFTVDNVLKGERVAYCAAAELYDEQPTTFAQSWRQRMRWAKGYIQVFRKYGGKLFGGILRGSFACFDMTMAILPAIVLTVASVIINGIVAAYTIAHGAGNLMVILQSVGETVFNAYLALFGIGVITTITEWRKIHSPAQKKALYCLTFPLFMLTYIPISVTALFRKVEWKPIHHTVSKTLEDVKGISQKSLGA